ncbi:hypothetical protein RB195_001193 [Necator americanus]|uniref:SH3 domain protein n=1 Tax=Necator americanus TaxID=51031 RepID=A0ABR1DD71_NECAM
MRNLEGDRVRPTRWGDVFAARMDQLRAQLDTAQGPRQLNELSENRDYWAEVETDPGIVLEDGSDDRKRDEKDQSNGVTLVRHCRDAVTHESSKRALVLLQKCTESAIIFISEGERGEHQKKSESLAVFQLMPVYLTLLGGPPWGMRLGSDQELRPVIAKILTNGRAAREGLKPGDVLYSVNNIPVFTCKQAHSLIQKAEGKLRLGIAKSSAGSTPIRSPREDNNRFLSPSAAYLQYSPSFTKMKNTRLDLEAARGGNTKLKRRFFEEQIAKNCVTDRLLQRKIQLGMVHNGAPSESTTGYDSVGADFAGCRSNTTSSMTSASPSPSDHDEVTIAENTIHAHSTPKFPIRSMQPSTMSAETNNERSETVIPDRRSVAELRRQITSRLEMKTPDSCSQTSKAPTSPLPNRHFTSNFIKVYEGADPENKKPYLGRVLDGPVGPDKYFQGVMPASAMQCTSPVPHSTPESKPPTPSKTTRRNSFLNRIARESSPVETLTPAVHAESVETRAEVRPSALTNSLSQADHHNEVVRSTGSNSIHNFAPTQELQHPATLSKQPIYNFVSSSQDLQHPPTPSQNPIRNFASSQDLQHPPTPSQNPIRNFASSQDLQHPPTLSQNSTRSFTLSQDGQHPPTPTTKPLPVHSFAPSEDLHYLPTPATTLTKKPFTEKSFETVFNMTPNRKPFEEVKSTNNAIEADKHNVRNESRMPDLLKSRSPAPFSLSTSPNERTTLFSGNTLHDDLTSSLTEALAAFNRPLPHSDVTSDSGYDGREERAPTSESTKFDGRPTSSDNGHSVTSFLTAPETVEDHSPSSVAPPSTVEMDRRIESRDSLLSGSESADHAHSTAGDAMLDRFQAGPSSHRDEMSLWYRNMFKKMHKVEAPEESSVLRHRLREASPALTISRPLTPLSFTAPTPSRHECEVTPRRARSVGRVVEPEMLATRSSTNLYANERARTPHFHLPSYKFVHEDPRPLFVDCGSVNGTRTCGIRCMRCGLRRKDPSWKDIDEVFEALSAEDRKMLNRTQQMHSRVALRCITENLDATAAELSVFIQRLEQYWKRSNSSPQLSVCDQSGSSLTAAAEELAELKRISKEELLYRHKAEKLAEELQEQRNRRHGYVPTASPSLLYNKDRFGGLLDEYSNRPSPTPLHATSVRTATAIFKFDAKSSRELSLNRGDIVRLRREVDANWLEGERNGQSGIFPRSYVQMDDEFDRSQSKLRAIYPFTARSVNELSLKMGELVTLRREIDENWIEGTNHLGEIGIFPRNYVRQQHDYGQNDEIAVSSPDRPKTPKTYENERPIGVTKSYSSSALHETSILPHTSNHTEDRLPGNALSNERSFTNDRSRSSKREDRRSERHLCTADKIPRGSQTYRALYRYVPTKDDEVDLEVDDIVFVVEKCDDGWYIGTVLRTGQFGTFPGNYVVRH